MAKAIGIDRGSLYKSLKDGSNLELNTMIKVLDYLGYEIQFIKSKRKEVKPGELNQSKKKEVVWTSYSILKHGCPMLTDIEDLEKAKKEALYFVASMGSEYIEIRDPDNETAP